MLLQTARDWLLCLDLIESAEKIKRFLLGKGFEDFVADEMRIQILPFLDQRPGRKPLSERNPATYQPIRDTSGRESKCSSRVSTGRRCWMESAAIQASFAGMGFPSFLRATRSPA